MRRNQRESSGRLWQTKNVADYLGIGTERVRQLVDEGKLKAHFTPFGLAIFMRDEVEDYGARRRGCNDAIARAKTNYGMEGPKVVNIREQQGELPLMEKA